MRHAVLPSLVTTVCLASSACAASGPPAQAGASAAAAPAAQEEDVVGETDRDRVEAAVPDWAQAGAESAPDAEASRALASVEPGAEVEVYLATWCGDSRREVPRLWKALDLAGPAVPFEIRYVGVDREKKEPSAPLTNNDVRYVPTFIVRRGGEEVGRIVEGSPGGIEKDLLDLLTGRARGVISTRTDVSSPPDR